MSNNEENSSGIETPKQLITVVLCAFVFPITIIVLLAQYATGGISPDKSDSALSKEVVAKRLKPVGSLVLTNLSPQAGSVQNKKTGPAKSMAPLAVVSGGSGKVQTIYSASCSACHASGAAGAPKLGDKQAWAPRIKSGSEVLYNSAIKGKKAMPAKGGNVSLSNEDVKAVVDYMVSKAE
ncbi:MAG: c-type cytochrome [Nitrosomonadaceae bacterium]